MPIALRPETERRIEDRMKDGSYSSPDDVVQAALQLLEQRERRRQADLEDVRQKIAVGIEQLDRGDGLDGEQAFAELLAELGEPEEGG
jgi:antitoxin ParD1/3/4